MEKSGKPQFEDNISLKSNLNLNLLDFHNNWPKIIGSMPPIFTHQCLVSYSLISASRLNVIVQLVDSIFKLSTLICITKSYITLPLHRDIVHIQRDDQHNDWFAVHLLCSIHTLYKSTYHYFRLDYGYLSYSIHTKLKKSSKVGFIRSLTTKYFIIKMVSTMSKDQKLYETHYFRLCNGYPS